MATDFIDTIVSLTAIMEEETARLRSPVRHRDFAEMAAAKIKLVATLDTIIAARERSGADWMATLDGETREAVRDAIERLSTAARDNATVLERQIDLSTEMMAAVASEARRLSGSRSAIYGASGMVSRTEGATPISVNASL